MRYCHVLSNFGLESGSVQTADGIKLEVLASFSTENCQALLNS